jgi:hypothetical protein
MSFSKIPEGLWYFVLFLRVGTLSHNYWDFARMFKNPLPQFVLATYSPYNMTYVCIFRVRYWYGTTTRIRSQSCRRYAPDRVHRCVFCIGVVCCSTWSSRVIFGEWWSSVWSVSTACWFYIRICGSNSHTSVPSPDIRGVWRGRGLKRSISVRTMTCYL